ncbi:MAG: hypothetical protein IJG97_06920 [Bacilli bacterium]|nr:hypothetical protein [Bacilli bacterium]
MSIKKVFPLDPYDDNQLDMIKEFINNSGIESHYFNMLLDMKNNLSKEQYLDIKKQGNEIEELLIVEEDSKIRGYCHLLGEKDLKIYKLLFPDNDTHMKSIISSIMNYVQSELDFEEIFIELNSNDNINGKKLLDLGFESLGDEFGHTIFLKEKGAELEVQRKI